MDETKYTEEKNASRRLRLGPQRPFYFLLLSFEVIQIKCIFFIYILCEFRTSFQNPQSYPKIYKIQIDIIFVIISTRVLLRQIPDVSLRGQ